MKVYKICEYFRVNGSFSGVFEKQKNALDKHQVTVCIKFKVNAAQTMTHLGFYPVLTNRNKDWEFQNHIKREPK